MDLLKNFDKVRCQGEVANHDLVTNIEQVTDASKVSSTSKDH